MNGIACSSPTPTLSISSNTNHLQTGKNQSNCWGRYPNVKQKTQVKIWTHELIVMNHRYNYYIILSDVDVTPKSMKTGENLTSQKSNNIYMSIYVYMYMLIHDEKQ